MKKPHNPADDKFYPCARCHKPKPTTVVHHAGQWLCARCHDLICPVKTETVNEKET